MSLYDKTNPDSRDQSERRLAAAGVPIDPQPLCEYCAQHAGYCLCGGTFEDEE